MLMLPRVLAANVYSLRAALLDHCSFWLKRGSCSLPRRALPRQRRSVDTSFATPQLCNWFPWLCACRAWTLDPSWPQRHEGCRLFQLVAGQANTGGLVLRPPHRSDHMIPLHTEAADSRRQGRSSTEGVRRGWSVCFEVPAAGNAL